MKKFLAVVAMILAFCMCTIAFVSCNETATTPTGKTEETTGTPTTGEATAGDKVTVTWYKGSEELKSEQVAKGTKLEAWTPEAGENQEFDGWYAEASCEQAFDFTKEITEDTDIFAKFRNNEYVEDTTSYYLIGGGAGDIGQSNWDHTAAAEKFTMTKQEVEKANVYKIQIKLLAGDAFQICYGGAWDGQTGIGYIEGAEYVAGTNKYDGKEYTAEDKKVAEVKDTDGNTLFIGHDEYNKGFESWNAVLADGQDGIYEITFTTYPNAKDYNKITVKLIEKVAALAETHKMQLVGTFNGWNPDDTTAEYVMKKSDDGKTWSAFITLKGDETYEDNGETKNGVSFKVVNQITKDWIGDQAAGGANFTLTEAGTYAVKYTVDGNVAEVKKCEYYVVGTFVDSENKAVNFSIKEGVTPKLTVADGVGTCTFTATDVTGIEGTGYSWIKDQGKPGVFAIKVVFGCDLGIKDWFDDKANNGDNFYLTAGEHTVTFTIETGAVTVA